MGKFPTDPILAYDKKQKPIFGYDKDGIPVCFSRRPGHPENERCMATARMPNGRCGKHGGKSPVGIAHPSFRHGEYMKNLPSRVAADLANASKDEDYISLKAEMDMNTVQLIELMRDFDEGYDEHTYDIIQRYSNKLEVLINSDKVGKFIKAMGGENSELSLLVTISEKLNAAIKSGADSKKLHKEIAEVAERRRKLAETEIKRIALERNHLPLDQAMTVYGIIMLSIQKHVKDPVALRAISRDVDGIVILRQIAARTQQIDLQVLEEKGRKLREEKQFQMDNPTETQMFKSLEETRIIDPEKTERQKRLMAEMGIDDDEDNDE